MSLANIKQNLVSWWAMQETVEPRLDSHGSNNIVKTGASASDAIAEGGIIGNAIRFEGIEDRTYGNLTTAEMKAPGDFSIHAWVYPFSASNTQPVAGRWSFDPTLERSFFMRLSSSNVLEGLFSADGTAETIVLSDQPAFELDVWSHAVLVRSGDVVNLYSNNGKYVGAFVGPVFDPTMYWQVGGWSRNNTSNFRRFMGRLDEVAYWDRALTDAEVASLYNTGAGVTYTDLPELPGGGVVTARGFANMDRNFINMRG